MNTLKLKSIFCAVMLAACSQPTSSPETSQNASNVSGADLPVYRVVTDATYPPFESIDNKGHVVGLDVDLMNAIAENQGFRVEYRVQVWEGMFDELKNDKADIIASAISISDNEENIALLSQPYLKSHDCVAANNQKKLATWAKGSVAAARNEFLHEDLIDTFSMHKDQIQLFDTPFLGLKEVAANRVDASVADCTVMTYYAHSPTFQDFQFHMKELPTDSDDGITLVFGVNPNNPELLQKINQGLANVKQSGQYDQILQKWRLK